MSALILSALFAATGSPDYRQREAATGCLAAMVASDPGRFGPQLAALSARDPSPERRARAARPLAVYRAHRARVFTPGPRGWPCCDSDRDNDPYGWQPWLTETPSGPEYKLESGPYWHRYRRATESQARAAILGGADEREVRKWLAKLWEAEDRRHSDMPANCPERAEWVMGADGLPRPETKP